MQDHRNTFELEFGPVTKPGERGGAERLRQEHPPLYGQLGQSWEEENVQSTDPPYIEIIPSWSVKRKMRKFIRRMDLVYHKICGLRDIIEENPSNQIYDRLPVTKSTAIIRHCPLPPPSTLFGAGARLKDGTVEMDGIEI